MRTPYRLMIAGTLVLACASAAAVAGQTPPTPRRIRRPASTIVPDEARTQIKAANDAWLPAMQREDAAVIVEPYADDAVFVMATGEAARGRAAIEQLMRDRFAKVKVVGGSITQDGLTMAGSLIYEWGHAEMNVVRPGQAPAKTAGQYLTVWKKDASGRWRIIRNLSL